MKCLMVLALAGACAPALADSPFAAAWLSYEPGLTDSPTYTGNPGAAVGSPERMTGEFYNFPSVVTPFNPAYGPDEVVSVGGGGSLVLMFDHPVVDDPANPYGLDLIVFGNAGFVDDSYPEGRTLPGAAMFGSGALARVLVSADGSAWREIAGAVDARFPTLGYSDLADPYSLTAGAVGADFEVPVNPAFDPSSRSFAELVAGYAGSGGGAGFDLAGTGLASILYIRFENLGAGTAAFEIDAVSDVRAVPAPGVALGLLALGARARRRHR